MSSEIDLDNQGHLNYGSAAQPEPKQAELRLPLYLDASLTISRILVMVLGVSITLISLYAGCTLEIAALRGGLATLTVGLIAWFLNWFINQYSLEEAIAEIEKENENNESNDESTIEREA